MCIILPVDHLSCTHTVAVWHHCSKAPTTRLFGPAPCGRIRQHSRPILTRKLCYNCGGPRLLNFRRSTGIGQIKEEEKQDSGYSTTRESLTASEKSRNSIEEENEEAETKSEGDVKEKEKELLEEDKENDGLVLLRRSASYRPHTYRNGHWTPRRGSEYSSSTRSRRISQLSRSFYSESGSEVSEFEDAIGKASGSDWPKSPLGIHLSPGGLQQPQVRPDSRNGPNSHNPIQYPTITLKHVPKSYSNNNPVVARSPSSSPGESPQNEHPYWDTGPIKPDPSSPNSSSSNDDSISALRFFDDSDSNSSHSSHLLLPGVEEETEEEHDNGKRDSHCSPYYTTNDGDVVNFDEPSPLEIEQYSVIMATTAKMARASRISFHHGAPQRAGSLRASGAWGPTGVGGIGRGGGGGAPGD